MLTKILIIIVLIAGLSGIGYFYNQAKNPVQPAEPLIVASPTPQAKIKPFDFVNKSIQIDDTTLAFKDGQYADASHSATIEKKATSPDGMHSAALVIDQPGGSGTFYYLVGAIMKDGTEMYSSPVLLGDRIEFQTAEVADPGENDNGEITVTYLDRTPRQPMSATPTIEITKRYSFEDNGELIEVLN